MRSETLGEYPMAEQIRRIEPEKSASNEGVANLTLAPWQCNSQMNTIWVVMTTSILIICSLTVLLFGFDSSSRNESNRFPR
jgi:hypothetical protein